jgi:pimeloyl-ACP methyl ester carboxylesterase
MKIWRITLGLGFLAVAAAAEIELHEGEIEGAPFAVAQPANWTEGKVFFHVNGWRPEHAPHVADLDVNHPLYAKLLENGWVIGRTAFLANGVDHDAHTKALWDLRAWIEAELGEIETLILEGESTAGTLVLRIAEQDPELADGVVALGPFVDLVDTESDWFLTAKPMLPAVLLTNKTEILDDLEYVTVGAAMDPPPALRPSLRPGHMNMNWVERWEAFAAVDAAVRHGKPVSFANGTFAVPERVTGTEMGDGGLVNKVTAVNVFYGNAHLGFHPDELAKAGISQGDFIEVEAGGDSWTVLYGVTYADVEQGEWLAFPTADDDVLLVRNHKSAIATAGLDVGDSVRISKVD